MLALTTLVYLNGGVQSPLIYVPIIAVMLSGLVLPRPGMFLQANLGAALLALMAVGEYAGWLPHILFISAKYDAGWYREPQVAASMVLSIVGDAERGGCLDVQHDAAAEPGRRADLALLGQLQRQVGEAANRLAHETRSIQGEVEGAIQVAGEIAVTVHQITEGACQQAAQFEGLARQPGRTGRRSAAHGAGDTGGAPGRPPGIDHSRPGATGHAGGDRPHPGVCARAGRRRDGPGSPGGAVGPDRRHRRRH